MTKRPPKLNTTLRIRSNLEYHQFNFPHDHFSCYVRYVYAKSILKIKQLWTLDVELLRLGRSQISERLVITFGKVPNIFQLLITFQYSTLVSSRPFVPVQLGVPRNRPHYQRRHSARRSAKNNLHPEHSAKQRFLHLRVLITLHKYEQSHHSLFLEGCRSPSP